MPRLGGGVGAHPRIAVILLKRGTTQSMKEWAKGRGGEQAETDNRGREEGEDRRQQLQGSRDGITA